MAWVLVVGPFPVRERGRRDVNRVLLRGGRVLSVDPRVGDHVVGDVLIEGSQISAVGPSLAAPGAQVIDASGLIVMPGFVDTHRHLWQTILRNAGRSVPLLPSSPGASELVEAFRPEDVLASTRWGLLGALDAGVTTVLDWSDIQVTPDHTAAAVEAHRRSGVRSILAYGAAAGGNAASFAAGIEAAVSADSMDSDGRPDMAMAAQGPERVSAEESAAEWDLARRLDLRISVHVGVGERGGRGRLDELGRTGILGDDTTYVHCNRLTDPEIAMIGATGGSVSVATSAEMTLGFGMPPVQRLLDHGLNPSLGAGTETNVPPDMFAQMRSVLALQHAFAHEGGLAGGESPPLITPADVVRYATLEGAKATGLESVMGSLTPGKQADLILLQTDRINVLPVNDPYLAVVTGMHGGNVDSVFVAGRPVKRHGELLGVDWRSAARMMEASRVHVIDTARLDPSDV